MTSVPSILDMDLQLANLDATVRIFLVSGLLLRNLRGICMYIYIYVYIYII